MIERFLGRLSVRQRIAGGFLVIVLLLILPVPLLVANRTFLVNRLQQVTEVEARAERNLLRASARAASARVNLSRYLQDHLPSPSEALQDIEQAIQLLTETRELVESSEQERALALVLGKLVESRGLINEVVAVRSDEESQEYVRLAFQAYGLGNEISEQIEQIVQDSEQQVAAANERALVETQNAVMAMAVSYVGMLILAGILSIVVARSVTRPLTQLRDGAEAFRQGQRDVTISITGTDELGLLGQTFNQLAAELSQSYLELEQRVADRTDELERRSAYLEASAEVGRAASSILDADQLITEVVELIRERFALYYVGLFVVDEAHEQAVLRAGTGEAGRAMLARGHRIRVGEGMIGWSVANAQARVSLDVQSTGDDAVRLATAELPDTRSEAAIPLRSRGHVIGALTVQSDQPGAFDEATITVLQTMADQVAVTLENARLFAESQQALDAERRAYGELTRQAWSELLRTQADWGYRYAQEAVAPTAGNWQPEMSRAAQSGHSVQGNSAGRPTLAVPVKVRDQVIGVLSFRRDKDGKRWTAEETTMLETLTDQIGQALESARLHQETQQRAARERLTREITDNIRAAVSVEDAIQRAVHEMGRALGASEMVVRLGSEQDLTSEQGGNGYE